MQNAGRFAVQRLKARRGDWPGQRMEKVGFGDQADGEQKVAIICKNRRFCSFYPLGA